MKRLLSIGVIVVCAAVAVTAQQRPAVFPGAVPAEPGSSSVFLTRASWAEVNSFYRRAVGEPLTVSEDRSAFFVYSSTPASSASTWHTGVLITRHQQPGNAVAEVFAELQSCSRRGWLTQAQLDEIRHKYHQLSLLHFRDSGSGNSVDAEIVREHKNFLRTGSRLDMEAFTEQIMQMAMRGDRAGMDRLKKEQEANVTRVQLLQSTAAQVDFWIECLESIEAQAAEHGFPVRIEMDYTEQHMKPGMKG
ncbi:MAG: hypothetical protein EA404_06050 [Spirochaetaceae bacterium]|nr:MAG: hypothetical protein EA404_06050 [Spirochaetaceae bacterium]